jgi:hypothetical protein
MRTPFKSVSQFLASKYPGLASVPPTPWGSAKPAFQSSWGAAQPAFQSSWGAAQPAFQVASTDADEDANGDGGYEEDEDVSTRLEQQLNLRRMTERFADDDFDVEFAPDPQFLPPPNRKQKQRAKMHSGFKAAPPNSDNPECKQS